MHILLGGHLLHKQALKGNSSVNTWYMFKFVVKTFIITSLYKPANTVNTAESISLCFQMVYFNDIFKGHRWT